MRRKVVGWTEYQPPREWTPVLECGHPVEFYDVGGLADDTKANVERDGFWSCDDCSRAEVEIKRLEKELETARAKLSVQKRSNVR